MVIYLNKLTKVFAEIKCKRDDTIISVNNLRRTLYAASKQLPTDNPSIVFVRIPTSWIQYENLANEINKIIHNFFLNVPNINGVIFIWEEWIDLQKDFRASTLKYKLELNQLPTDPINNLNNLLLPMKIPSDIKDTFMELSFRKFI